MTQPADGRSRRIVVGVDGSPSSVSALKWAISEAGLHGDTSAEADLLVVGSRGHGAFADALLGSVSQHCAHHSKCPLVVVRGQPGA